MIFEGHTERIQQLGVRCTVWSHMETILAQLFQTAAIPNNTPLPIERVVPFFSRSARFYEQHPHMVFPALKALLPDQVPIHLPSFASNGVVVLSLKNIPPPDSDRSIHHILLANQQTLRCSELYSDCSPGSSDIKAFTLFHAHNLSVGFVEPLTVIPVIETLNLRSLRRLPEDCWNRLEVFGAKFYGHRVFIYESMMNHWPLDQVADLKLSHAIFYETEQNAISLLTSLLTLSQMGIMDWEMQGIPTFIVPGLSSRR
ncbi:hypothetical protein E1B28_009534 [Marasmius oreades]|uniref:Uncharacterized protein n=1 Tax=Marasmius oreades TaxID=181124 RepID=A0A9P7RW06_9AGAR|nr:uncharacterized protein E1B28_009534 [Marasmius oreades]KAG7090415.1 hypothetical protein E1B28_009534 [Marasmius oreades]